MKKIITVGLLLAVLSCTPYHKVLLIPADRNSLLHNSCDVEAILNLKQFFDTSSYWNYDDPGILLNIVNNDTACTYYSEKFFHPREQDSAIWLLTIRPVQVGEDEIILGNLYTFYPDRNSIQTFDRRVKEYSQTEVFESGKYVKFTYYIENDTTIIVKTGTSIL